MPSLHAADALIIGVTLSGVARGPIAKVVFLLWPAWVCFSLIATANHFWLDIAAGLALAAVGAWTARLLERPRLRTFRRSGSDGTRTRDLRRDSPVLVVPVWAGIGGDYRCQQGFPTVVLRGSPGARGSLR